MVLPYIDHVLSFMWALETLCSYKKLSPILLLSVIFCSIPFTYGTLMFYTGMLVFSLILLNDCCDQDYHGSFQ